METVKILIACHKPYDGYRDKVYTPIHVGRAISNYKEEMLDMIGDDTGENISNKNPYYCELTAQYWAWKNLKNTKYVGLAHYRRFLGCKFTEENTSFLFNQDKYDVILPMPIYCRTDVATRLALASTQEDLHIFLAVIKKQKPEYYPAALQYIQNNIVIGYNMFVMKYDIFSQFAEWQFNILFEMEKYVKVSSYTRAKRIFGYYAEALLPIYCIKNGFNIRYVDINPCLTDCTNISFAVVKRLKSKYSFIKSKVYFRMSQKLYLKEPAVFLGLRTDFKTTDIDKFFLYNE